MFKPISSALEKRAQKYKVRNTAQQSVQNQLFQAMTPPLRAILQTKDIRYDYQSGDITLITHHRAVANEMALQLDKIYECAHQSGVRFSRVLITME